MLDDKESKLILLSILYQVLDGEPEIEHINPNIVDYLYGLSEELEEIRLENEETFVHIYHYADSYFNKIYGAGETLH